MLEHSFSRLWTVNCVSNTDGVRRERYTQLNSKSFSAAVSHTCVRMRMISLTIPFGLIWQIFKKFCLWCVIVTPDFETCLFESRSARSPFSWPRPYCPPPVLVVVSSKSQQLAFVSFFWSCHLFKLLCSPYSLRWSSGPILHPFMLLVVFPFQCLPNPNSWCLLLSGLYQLVRSIPVRHTHAVGKAPGFRRTSDAFNTQPESWVLLAVD